jgi:hypothetical protein
MPFFSASAIHPAYRCREFGEPVWTRIGFPSANAGNLHAQFTPTGDRYRPGLYAVGH